MRYRSVSQILENSRWAKTALYCTTALLVFSSGPGIGALWGQGQDIKLPASQLNGGLQILNISGYSAYYSSGLPSTGGFQAGAANFPSDVAAGGSTTIGWTKFGESSTFSLTYTPSYTGRVRYSSVNALNHAFSLNTTRKLAPRWNFSFSVRADYSSLEQAVFSPTTLSSVASAPASFADLAAATIGAKFTNPQLTSILVSAPLVESPLRTLLYGQRMLTSGVQTSVSYSYSPRLSVSVTASGNRSQHVSESGPAFENSFLIPNTTSGTAGVTVSYSLSPLTQLSGSVNTTRVESSLQDLYATTSLVSLGHTFGQRWFLQIHGGMGVTNPVRQTSSLLLSTRPHPAAGGSLGFKTFSHSLLGSYDRTVSDPYGLGATTTSSVGFNWRWKHPGRVWWLESNLGWQQLQGNAITNTSGWQTTTGLGRMVGAHIVLLAQYAYLKYSGGLQTSAYHLSQSAARVSMVWTPHPNLLQ